MVWIVGAGNIGQEYAKILTDLNVEYTAIGRGEKSAAKFREAIGHDIETGGIDNYISTKPVVPEKAIVAVRTPELASITIALINYGVKEVLCEKPGFCEPAELDSVLAATKANGAKVYYAYNRRFYSSTLKAEEIIKEDGGITSFNFEFTEWTDRVGAVGYDNSILNYWFYGNSTHVVDLAFFLGGFPKEIQCFTANKIAWHNPSSFAGAGVTDKGALFCYQANWDAPGRWVIEILTKKHRLYFKPMETLQFQEMNSVRVNPVEIDDSLDKKYKPGFYLETKAFIEGKTERFCSLEQQVNHVKNFYKKICNPIK